MNRARLEACLLGSFALALGCAGVKQNPGTGSGGSGNGPGIGGFGGGMTMAMPCVGMCMDFPPTPMVVGSAPANAATIFGSAGQRLQRRSLPDRAAGQHAVPQQLAAPALPFHQRRRPLRDPPARGQPGQRSGRVHDRHDLDDAQGHLDAARRPHARHADRGDRAQRAARRRAGPGRQRRSTSRSRPSARTASWSTGRRRARPTSTASRPGPRPC